jgi:hypothetical protein
MRDIIIRNGANYTVICAGKCLVTGRSTAPTSTTFALTQPQNLHKIKVIFQHSATQTFTIVWTRAQITHKIISIFPIVQVKSPAQLGRLGQVP